MKNEKRKSEVVSCGVLLLLLIPVLHAARPAGAQTVVLRPQATVDTAQITVAQVADVSSPDAADAERVGKLVIADAGAANSAVTVTLASARGKLAELGVNRAVWSLVGASACRVTRVAAPSEQITELQQRSQRLRDGLSGTMAGLPEAMIADSLAGCVSQVLKTQFERDGATVALTFDPSDKPVLALQRPQFRFEIAIKRISDGFVIVTSRVFSDEQLVKNLEFRVKVELVAPVALAARQVNRGQVLTAADVTLRPRAIPLTCAAARDLKSIIGQQAKRSLKPDDLVEPGDLSPLSLVQRNKVVAVWVRNNALLIKTAGRAMQDGAFGERVLVRNEASRQMFYAVVTGPDTVELDPTPVQEARTPAAPSAKPAASPAPAAGQPIESKSEPEIANVPVEPWPTETDDQVASKKK